MLEGRVQQYRDFVSFCSTSLANIQANLQRTQSALKQLDNNVLQDRQNLAFTSQLLAEEILRVKAVNDKRLSKRFLQAAAESVQTASPAGDARQGRRR